MLFVSDSCHGGNYGGDGVGGGNIEAAKLWWRWQQKKQGQWLQWRQQW
jgi:hypothetical protein